MASRGRRQVHEILHEGHRDVRHGPEAASNFIRFGLQQVRNIVHGHGTNSILREAKLTFTLQSTSTI